MRLDGLDDNDGVVDDDADGQDEAEEGQVVDAIPPPPPWPQTRR